jgi:hypothetical protein
MASIKKQYSFTNKRDIWRLIPSESGYLVIEERDLNTKEVFFNCLKTYDGKVLFKNFQLDEKYWIGIESVYKSTIFFHKFRKPDMPGHKGIYAFDISTKNLIWQNDSLIFMLANDEKVYAYQSTFEGRHYYMLDCLNGTILKDYGSDYGEINRMREELMQNDFVNSFLIPKAFKQGEENSNTENIINTLQADRKITGSINWLSTHDYLMFNYHEQNSDGSFNNYLKVFNTIKNKIALTETLNSKSKNLIFESFFIINDLLLLLVEKQRLVVYRIMQ